MIDDWLYEQMSFVILLGTLLVLLLAFGVGYYAGRRARQEGEEDPQINTIQAATLGLLGLLLAFTFSMAASRYETRRGLVLEEANSIGTTALRAKMLPEPIRTETNDLLRQYVDARLEFYAAGVDADQVQLAVEKSEQIQDQLWEMAVAASALDPRSVPTGLFITSLNEVIDLHAARLAAMKNRVPEIIIDLIYLVSMITLGLIGYSLGIAQHRSIIPTLMAIILIAMIIMVIVDLDAPRSGLIRISQESMIQLQQSFK